MIAAATMSLLAQTMPVHGKMSEAISPHMGVFFLAFFLSFLVTPVMRELAIRNGIIDMPDLKRKGHLKPVAYLGGVAIFVGWSAGAATCFLMWPQTSGVMMSVMLGAAAITITGVLDDVYKISPRVKIGGQLFAAAALALQDVGVKLAQSAVDLMNLGPYVPSQVVYILGAVLIAVFVIGGCNATNLLDGLDGLAAGVSAIACAGFLIIAAIVATRGMSGDEANILLTNDVGDTVGRVTVMGTIRFSMILATLGALLGFLPYNFNPASIFMGDAGSLLIGYLCVAAILLFTPDTAAAAPKLVTAMLIVFALPITDTLLAIIRRKMEGKPITAPDNGHIHHLLRRSGLGVKKTVLLLYGIAILFAAVGVGLIWLDLRWRYILAVFFPLYGFIMVFLYHYGQHLAMRDKMRQERETSGESSEEPVQQTQA